MSDQDTNIFNNNGATTPVTQVSSNAPNTSQTDPYADLLGSIKNERGEPKYKTLQDAIVALKHSQDYIPQLTTKLSQQELELNTAKAEAAKIAELERTLEALTSQQSLPVATTIPAGLTEDKVAELVNRTLSRKQAEDTQKSNTAKVVEALQAKFGADAEKMFYGKASELGMSPEQFNKLAATTPLAALNLLGVNAVAQAPRTNTAVGSLNTEAFQPQETSFVGRNKKPMIIGATTQDLHDEAHSAREMVKELHSQGKSVYDLTDPKVYFKIFK